MKKKAKKIKAKKRVSKKVKVRLSKKLLKKVRGSGGCQDATTADAPWN